MLLILYPKYVTSIVKYMSEILYDQQPVAPEDAYDIPRINEAILKIHSRCNLDCDYCYVYNLGDDSWRDQPRVMTSETMQAFADRVGEYLDEAPPKTFHVTFHGGEPLLAPPEAFDEAVQLLRRSAPARTIMQFAVQTNGTLLTEKYLKTFRRNAVSIGVSLDGGREQNDVHRVTRGGDPSYEMAAKNITTMIRDPRYRKLFTGILAVIDIQNDPLETYYGLLKFKPPRIDFLLPHGNWDTLPPGLETEYLRRDGPYATWLNAIFDEWFPDHTSDVRIRIFDSLIHLLTGGRSSFEGVGMSENGLVVVETDGSYEMVDTLKATPGQVAKTGLHVRRHSLHEAQTYMLQKQRTLGALTVAEVCKLCPILQQCGGGYLPHRFESGNAFNRETVYCQDMQQLVPHVFGGLNEHALRHKSTEYLRNFRLNELSQQYRRA